MAVYQRMTKYIPWTYVRPRPDAAELSNRFIREWDEKRLESTEPGAQILLPPTICFSRKAGAGALEIADILAEKIGYRVVDRQIMEYIAGEANLSEKTVSFFDERYPGKLAEFLALAFGEKAFIKSDYARLLFSAGCPSPRWGAPSLSAAGPICSCPETGCWPCV